FVYLIVSGVGSLLSSLIFILLSVYYVRIVGMNALQLVLVGTAIEGTMFLLQIPTGLLADMYSRRLSIVIGLFLIGICYTIEGAVPLFLAIIVAEIIRGIGESFLDGAFNAWIADEVGPENVAAIYLRGVQVGQLGGIAGIVLGVALAMFGLNLPVLVGGLLRVGLAIFAAVAMPETGFHPQASRHSAASAHGERKSVGTVFGKFRDSLWAVRASSLILTILVVEVIFGAFSEGFDRLWEAHVLQNVEFPALGALDPVAWFGILGIAGMIVGVILVGVARRLLRTENNAAMARSLLTINAMLIASVVMFGSAHAFGVAVAALWTAGLMRTLAGPLTDTWLNQNVESGVRATVLSMKGQANAFGQILVGPLVGVIGLLFTIRASMVISALMLTPTLLLYLRALRKSASTGAVAPIPAVPGNEVGTMESGKY
ncbi:MAG TPA: MFS transporter, partial [Aggregatilineales bacterium]|nr:MFS transporter [Aggregatilineales bacterium]